MSLRIADAIVTVKELTQTNDVGVVGATLFVHKHCTEEEIESIESELRPQSVRKVGGDDGIGGAKTEINL